MPDYEYIEVSATGHPHFPRSHSFSHHHRPRRARPRCPDNCACVTLEAWNDMLESERRARAAHDALARENRTLEGDLRAARQESRRLQGEVDRLAAARDVEDKLRRRVAALKAELDELRGLQKAKEIADIRVRELSQTVTDQSAEMAQLEDEIARLGRVHKKDQHDLGVRNEEVREAWSLVGDLRRQLRRWREPSFFHRRYNFTS